MVCCCYDGPQWFLPPGIQCPCAISSPWVWSGLIDLLLMDRYGRYEDHGFILGCTLALLFWGKPAAMVQGSPMRRPTEVSSEEDIVRPAASIVHELESRSALFPPQSVLEITAAMPVTLLQPWLSPYRSLVKGLSKDLLVKPLLDPRPTETLR